MKSIQNLNTRYNANTLRQQYIEKFGQLFSVSDYDFSSDVSVKNAFDWQLESINKIALERFGINIAPCGSGKTLVMQIIAAIDNLNDPKRKQVILVSESAHSENFIFPCDIKFKLLNKKIRVSWAAPENFTEESFLNSKTDEAKSWLLSKNSNPIQKKKNFIKGSVSVMTHSLFNRIFQTCTEVEKRQIFKNLTVIVDESHHLKGLSSEKDTEMTQLSKAVSFLIDNATKLDSRAFLFTATFFRGDHAEILGGENLDKFKVYQLEYVRHFLSLGIENYDIVHDFYTIDPIKNIANKFRACIQKGLMKHYVVVPPMAQWDGNWRLLDPNCERLKRELVKVMMEELGYTKEKAYKRILDLVDQNLQKLNKKALSSEPKAGQDISNSQYDVVLTCKIGREGTDWPVCCVVHNASPEKTPTIAVQTVGRVTRRYPNKKNVICFYYLRDFIKIEDPNCKTKEDLIADRVHYLIMTMLMDEYLRPILLPIIQKNKNNQNKSKGRKTKKTLKDYVAISDIFGDQWNLVKENIIRELAVRPVTEHNVDIVIESILDKYEYSSEVSVEDIKDGLKVFILKCKSPKFREEFIDVSFIRKNNFNNLVRGEQESLFYRIERSDWKTFQILKEDALANEQMDLLCKQIPEVKAKELGKCVGQLTRSERHDSLRDLYDFRDACLRLEESKKRQTLRVLAKSLNTNENVLKVRIDGYNQIFKKMGKPLIIVN